MDVESSATGEVQVGDEFSVTAKIDLAGMTPEHVTVELYQGTVDAVGNIVGGMTTIMEPVEPDGDSYVFTAGAVAFTTSGKHGYTVRVLPYHPDLANPHRMGLIRWG
jgi:starch phosphorylase